ncbi:MAG TPA: hypothetical protein VM223_21580, partial [Planctomycetota bacterium]|nr:hypothetical protein [Planctomycetota bacterium]
PDVNGGKSAMTSDGGRLIPARDIPVLARFHRWNALKHTFRGLSRMVPGTLHGRPSNGGFTAIQRANRAR